jgi:hypothetical protein
MTRELVRLFLRIRHVRNVERLASFRQRDPRIKALLYASRLARLFDGGDPDILVRCRYSGLRGRRLDCLTPGRHFSFERICNDDNAELQTQATASQMDDNLVEVLHSLLVPLYERFAFFELSRELVRIEIEQMRKNRF